mmetsp:Transcript_10694/g.38723  ORF Transcript_10694/g.38723 Transcript_10694/m.38723 type:complete len:276 (-) Transcript_10694:1032-1859(-)
MARPIAAPTRRHRDSDGASSAPARNQNRPLSSSTVNTEEEEEYDEEVGRTVPVDRSSSSSSASPVVELFSGGKKSSRTSSWKNSFVTPPSSTPSSSTPSDENRTRIGFFKSAGDRDATALVASCNSLSRFTLISRKLASCDPKGISPPRWRSRDARISCRFCRFASPCNTRLFASRDKTHGIWQNDARPPGRAHRGYPTPVLHASRSVVGSRRGGAFGLSSAAASPSAPSSRPAATPAAALSSASSRATSSSSSTSLIHRMYSSLRSIASLSASR